ncbi:hypothetical protein WJX84_008214 [Apatococcus fuscideae]|uniref:Plant heme peroxidase family profile domain-containing protein n=1 Tax=Apatococcus fuscideae TaxID=2026836 RepID=A0AAW1TAF1_9CHLO
MHMLVALFTLGLLGLAPWLISNHRLASNNTPTVASWPVFGSILPFATRGASFIHVCRLKYGDAFRLRLPGQSVVFLFHPKAIQVFFQSPDSEISFRLAVERFTNRVFGLPSKDFYPQHMAMLDALRGLLTPQHMHGLAQVQLAAMRDAADAILPAHGEVDLMETVSQVLTPAAIRMLFGAAFLERHGTQAVLRAFATFESGFELAASPVPHWLQPGWRRARAWLLSALRQSLACGDLEGQVVGQLLHQVPMPQQATPHILLAVLWASLANTVPATFWTLAYLLQPEHAHHMEDVQRLITGNGADQGPPPVGQRCGQHHRSVPTEVLQDAGGGCDFQHANDQDAALIQVAMQRGTKLAVCISEAVRLQAPGMDIRIAAQDLRLPADDSGRMHTISQGQLLAVSPYESHRDLRLFGEDAAGFRPDRLPISGMGGIPGVSGLAGMAFGGGRFRCPGRFLAEAEVALAAGFFLRHYSIYPGCRPMASAHRKQVSLQPQNDKLSSEGRQCPKGAPNPQAISQSSSDALGEPADPHQPDDMAAPTNTRADTGSRKIDHRRDGINHKLDRRLHSVEHDEAKQSKGGLRGGAECCLLPPAELRRQVGVRSSTKYGGANGSIRNEKELRHPGNEGLKAAVEALGGIKESHPSLTYADLYQLAGIVALETSGGPVVPFRAGRRDSAISPPEGRIPTLLDASGKPSLEEFKKAARRAGLSHRRLMVLCGAHTLCRWWATDTGAPPHLDKYYRDDTAFDNGYFRLLLTGKIPQDSVLLEDPELKMFALEYAKSQALFFQDYGAAHEQLSNLGTRLASTPGSRPSSSRPSGSSIFDTSSWTATEYAVGAAVVMAGSALAVGWWSRIWLKRRRHLPSKLIR